MFRSKPSNPTIFAFALGARIYFMLGKIPKGGRIVLNKIMYKDCLIENLNGGSFNFFPQLGQK